MKLTNTQFVCVTIVVLALIYAWWTKGRYEAAVGPSGGIWAFDKNTGSAFHAK